MTRASELISREYRFVWRMLRRLGLSRADAEDATQEVLVVAARRLADVKVGRERSFLVGTLLNVARTHRRTQTRRHEVLDPKVGQDQAAPWDPETLLLERWRLELLDRIVAELDWDLRVPFVLFEIEQLSVSEIAAMLEIPVGTAASRLRRAKKRFHEAARRLRARQVTGGTP